MKYSLQWAGENQVKFFFDENVYKKLWMIWITFNFIFSINLNLIEMI